MARGMIIDVDHMSEKATETALALAETYRYPVICSHTWFRDLLYSADVEYAEDKQELYGTSDVHKVAHEAGKRGDQIERIGRLGGVVAPIINQGDIAGLRRCLPELAGKIPTTVHRLQHSLGAGVSVRRGEDGRPGRRDRQRCQRRRRAAGSAVWAVRRLRREER